MPLSRYLQILPHPGQPDHLLLFSTRTGGLAVLPSASLESVRNNTANPELAATLANLAMVVDDPASEQAEVHGYLAAVNRANPNVRVAVILGMSCNFACVYCYEGSLKQSGAAMNDAVADGLVEFLLARFGREGEQPAKTRLILDFYGGEPLLYRSRIKYLASRIKPAIEAMGGRFEFTLVTNGSLLSREVVEELVGLGLVSFKVTIDGPPANHDRFRPFKDGRGSWEVIVNNLLACRGLCAITLSGNYTPENHAAFPALLDTLATAGFAPSDFDSVQFYPVMQVNDRFANPEFSGGCCSNDEPWVHAASLALRQAIMQRGYHFPPLHPAPCMVDLDDAMVVDHDGTLYKCVTLIGHPEFACGDIRQGMVEGWQATYCVGLWQKEEQCRACHYLPLCFGGCRAMAYQREGSMARVDCQRTLYDATLPAMLRQEIAHR